jgi:hypothetical protein
MTKPLRTMLKVPRSYNVISTAHNQSQIILEAPRIMSQAPRILNVSSTAAYNVACTQYITSKSLRMYNARTRSTAYNVESTSYNDKSTTYRI